MTVRIIVGDCLDILPTLDAESIDAVVTDPPYGIGFMGREWDSFSPDLVEKMARRRTRKATKRSSVAWPDRVGEQSQCGGVQVQYDESPNGNLRFQLWCTAWAAECLRVLKPGAHLVSFGGTRTYHRLIVGIEGAGFEIRDCLVYLYGSGFPKSLDVKRAIAVKTCQLPGRHFAATLPKERDRLPGDHVCPPTPESEPWDGYGTALKPGWEPIVLARKPFKGTVAANVTAHGTGGLNIDGCRIGTNGETWSGNEANAHDDYSGEVYGTFGKQYAKPSHDLGRWPANVVLDEVAAAMLDEQSGILQSGFMPAGTSKLPEGRDIFGEREGYRTKRDYGGDAGGASRFFFTAKPGAYCWLCDGLNNGKMSATKEALSCDHASSASNRSSPKSAVNGSVPDPAPRGLPLDFGGSNQSSESPALNAETTLTNGQATTGPIAPPNALPPLVEQIAQRVKSAGNLCDSCATATARDIAERLRDQNPVSPLTLDSTPDSKNSILTRNLAPFVEPWASIGTIPTTASLSILFGSVRHAIDESIRRASPDPNTESVPTRFLYTSKSSRAERNKGLDGMPERTPHPDEPNGRAWDIPGSHSTPRANHHPTVKPLDLMAWLVRLVTPPGGTVLDPFAGSGSTLVAADRQGFDAIGIEREAEYIQIIEARCRGDAPMFADVEVETGGDPPGGEHPRRRCHVGGAARRGGGSR